MARYEFFCDKCDNVREFFRSMEEGPPLEVRCSCGNVMNHVFGANFILVGSWPGKDLKSRDFKAAEAKEKDEHQFGEDKRNQRIVNEVTEERRKGTKHSKGFQKDNPQKMADYKKAIKAGYRAKGKSYKLKGDK